MSSPTVEHDGLFSLEPANRDGSLACMTSIGLLLLPEAGSKDARYNAADTQHLIIHCP